MASHALLPKGGVMNQLNLTDSELSCEIAKLTVMSWFTDDPKVFRSCLKDEVWSAIANRVIPKANGVYHGCYAIDYGNICHGYDLEDTLQDNLMPESLLKFFKKFSLAICPPEDFFKTFTGYLGTSVARGHKYWIMRESKTPTVPIDTLEISNKDEESRQFATEIVEALERWVKNRKSDL